MSQQNNHTREDRGNMVFLASDKLHASFVTHDKHHLCIIFYRDGRRVGSFCAERPYGMMDYLSESTNQSSPVDSLQHAIQLAEREP